MPRSLSQPSSSNEKETEQEGRRKAVVSLETFARGRGGVGKAIAKFRERRQRKRRHTAQALRQYQKVMKDAGYETGRGASRKRRRTESAEEEDETMAAQPSSQHPKEDDNGTEKEEAASEMPHKRHKTNPYKDLEKKHSQVRNAVVDPEVRQRERQLKLRERQQRTQRLRQRTAKGQPIMKNLVHDILDKLQKEKEPKP